MIEREILEQMFDNIAEQGDWNMAEPMLWGYFFTHNNAEQLRAAVAELQSRDYEFVNLWQSEKDDSNGEEQWWLHVQRIETHTVDTLFARNEQLSEFAAQHALDSYDGMDVGPVEKLNGPNN